MVSVQDDPSRQVSYGELIGNQRFDIQLEWNETYGNSLDAWGTAKPKTAAVAHAGPGEHTDMHQHAGEGHIDAAAFAARARKEIAHYCRSWPGLSADVEIRWPSGAIQKLDDVAVDRYLAVREP